MTKIITAITMITILAVLAVSAVAGTKYCLYDKPHTYVYRNWLHLTAGEQYIWETRDLRGAFWFVTPDTYMYLVRHNTIVAKNDDYNELASLIAYTPSVSGWYCLIIRASSKYNWGTCDVYQSVGGVTPTKIEDNVIFGGYPVGAHWKSDERILTRNATGDTYLYLIHGNTMLYDDDSGYGLCSSIRPGYHAWGLAVVGSYSTSTQGRTWLCNYYQSYLHNPVTRDEMDDPKILISERMEKFQIELMKKKPTLEKLSHKEREATVLKLRDSILSDQEIKQLGPPKFSVPKEFTAAFKRYVELLKGAEEKLKGMPHAERAAEMAKMEREKKEIFRDLVPQEWE